MLYLDYAKQTEDGYIMNFFADSTEDLGEISDGKEFITKNGTNYGVPQPQSIVTITDKDGEKTTYLMGEDGDWVPGVVDPTDYYTKEQVDTKIDKVETDIGALGTKVTKNETDISTLEDDVRYVEQDVVTKITGLHVWQGYNGTGTESYGVNTIHYTDDYEFPLVFEKEDKTLKVPLPKTKTLFGNQSVLGSGNIDLYSHTVAIDNGLDGNIYTVFYSSKNTVINSITNLMQAIGLERGYPWPAYGAVATGEPAVYLKINDSGELRAYYVKDGVITNTKITTTTCSDTVKTI